MLEILLLGQPEVRYNETRLSITRCTVCHMLVYLACSHDLSGRSELASIFCPEAAGSLANSHLRDTLRRLREQLPEIGYLLKYSTQVVLAPDGIEDEQLRGSVETFQQSVQG